MVNGFLGMCGVTPLVLDASGHTRIFLGVVRRVLYGSGSELSEDVNTRGGDSISILENFLFVFFLFVCHDDIVNAL